MSQGRSLDMSTRSVVSACVAALLAGAATVSVHAIGAVLVLVVLALAWGWPRLLALPARGGSSIVMGVGGLGALLAVDKTVDEPFLHNVPLIVAMGVVLAFVNELLRSDDRRRLVPSVVGTVTGVVVAVSATGWLAAARLDGGTAFVATAAIAMVAAAVVAAVPFYGWPSFGITVLVGTGVGAIAARLVSGPGLTAGLVMGFVAGLLVASLHMLLARVPARRGMAGSVAAIAAPVAIAGILVYAVARLTTAS